MAAFDQDKFCRGHSPGEGQRARHGNDVIVLRAVNLHRALVVRQRRLVIPVVRQHQPDQQPRIMRRPHPREPVEGRDQDQLVRRAVQAREGCGRAAADRFAHHAHRESRVGFPQLQIRLTGRPIDRRHRGRACAHAIAGIFQNIDRVARRKTWERVLTVDGLPGVAVQHQPDVLG